MGGVLCGVCQPDWAMSSSGLCLKCPEDTEGLQLGLALVALLFFLLGYYLFVMRPLLVRDTSEEEEGTTTSAGGNDWLSCARGLSMMAESTGLMRVANSRMGPILAAPFVIVARWVEEKLVYLLASFLKNSGAEVFKVLISFAQVSGSFMSNYSIKWPPMLQNFLTVCNMFTIKLMALPGSLSCVTMDMSHQMVQWTYLVFPICLLIAISLPAAYVSIRGPRHPRYNAVMKQWAWICTFVLFIVYPLLSGPALETFMCTPIGGGEQRLKNELRCAKTSPAPRRIEPFVRRTETCYDLQILAHLKRCSPREAQRLCP